MKLITNDSRIKTAVEWANKYFSSEDFKRDVLSVEKFDSANVTPIQILELFSTFGNRPIEVKCTYFGWFHRKVLGRTIGNGIVYVNTSSLGRQLWDEGETVVHEASHVVDEFFPEASFGHGSNSPSGKSRTFPYFIGERANVWIKRQVLLKEADRLAVRITLFREGVV